MKINPIIFKRFFFKKKANNHTGYILSLTFVILIALSSAMIIRTSFEIIKFQNKIDEFNSNEWNKVFQLFLKDCFVLSSDQDNYIENSTVPASVKTYLDSLAEIEGISYNPIYDMYPAPIKINSKNGVIPKVQVFLLGQNYSYIVDNLVEKINEENFWKKPYLFIEKSLIKNLDVKENDIVLIKDAFSSGSKYAIPLKVKIVDQKSRIKCFVFKDYLYSRGEKENKKIKFGFNNLNDALTFAFKELFLDWTTLETPYYINAEGITFLGIAKTEDYIRDFVLPAKSINLLNDINEITLKIYDSEGNTVNYPIEIYERKKSVVNIDAFRRKLKGKLKDIEKVEVANLLPSLKDISVQIDFDQNFSVSGKVTQKQEEIYKYIPKAEDFIIDYRPQKRKQIYDNVFFYYDQFSNNELTHQIMKKFDSFNIRWDSGRWKTVIDLNNSLEAGKKNIKLLLFVMIFVIICFLVIKFYLRLKLEFHSIGTLRCFGFSINEIRNVYTLGYFILIVFGFILGLFPFSYIMGLFSGLSSNEILTAYQELLMNPVNYVSAFLVILLILTYLVIYLILKNFIRHDNIYELIKYEN